MKTNLNLSTLWGGLAALALMVAVTGCTQEQIEEAESAVEETAGDVSAAAAEATEQVGEAAGDVKDAVSEEFTAAWDKASAALKDVEGGGELLTGMKSFFAGAKESLEGVTDEASAEKAKAKLGELGASVDGWGEKVAGMSDEAKTALKGFIEQGIAQMKSLLENFEDNELVQTVLKPKFDELMEKLKNLV